MASQPQPFQQLLALNEAVKAKNLEVAVQRQQAMSQAQQMPPTIYDQLKMALQQIQAQQPVPGMANGGMVAFDKGGLAEADLEDLDEDLVAEGLFDRPLIDYAIELLGGNVPQSRERPGAQERAADRGPTAPTRGLELTNLEKPLFDILVDQLSGTSRPPLNMRAEHPEPRAIRESKPPAGLAAAAATPPAGPTPPARPPAPRPAGTGAGGAGGAAAPQRGGLAEYLRMTEQLAKDVEGTAAVDPRVLEARQAYDATLKASMDPVEQQMRELEAQQALNIFENPELMSAILEGMKGTDRLGDTLMGAATGLVKARAGQKKEQREAKANLAKLRQELAKAEAEARLARAEKDVEGERRAKLKAAEIRAAMNETYVELENKQTTANAAATAAANRGAGTSDRLDFQKDVEVRKAIAAAQKAYPILPGISNPAIINKRIQEQIDMVAKQVASLGVTREQVVGYFSTSGQASAAPGASADPLGIR